MAKRQSAQAKVQIYLLFTHTFMTRFKYTMHPFGVFIRLKMYNINVLFIYFYSDRLLDLSVRDTQLYLTWKRIIGMTVLGLLRTKKDKADEETQVTRMRRERRGRQDETSK